MADPAYQQQQQPNMSQEIGGVYGAQGGHAHVSNGQYLPQGNMAGAPPSVKQVQEQRNSFPTTARLPNDEAASAGGGHVYQPPAGHSWPTQPTRAPFFSPTASGPAEARLANPQHYQTSAVNGPVKLNQPPRFPLTNGVQPVVNAARVMAPPATRPSFQQPAHPPQYGHHAPPTSDVSRQLPHTLHLPGHQQGPRSNAPVSSSGLGTPSPVVSDVTNPQAGQFQVAAPFNASQRSLHPSVMPPPQMPPQPQMTYYQPSVPPTLDGHPASNYRGQQQQPPTNSFQQRLPPQAYPSMTSANQDGVSHPSMPSVGSRQATEQWANQSHQQPHLTGPSLSGPTTAPSAQRLGQQFSNLSFQNAEAIDLLQNRNILPSTPVEPPRVLLSSYDNKPNNCSPDIFRCTLTKVPESQSVLHKSRLPLGILIHPFKDLTQLPVVQCNVIVRCRSCRTYINPFVQFLDQRRWKCNLCYRVNELQEEFQYDPISKSYGDPTRRPEIRSATIEFIAPSEYMLRPPQPAVYLFVLDVSYGAVETGYLRSFCDILLDNLDKLPGDSRTQIGFITFDSSVHFYNLAEGLSQPQMMVVSDIQEIYLPCPDNLLVNLNENIELVKDLLQQLPIQFTDSHCPDNALGAALEAAFKLVSATGGRVTVLQASLPNVGPGALKPREDPNLRAGKEVPNLGPANDYYKKLSLSCSSQQVAVDLFIISSQYCDIATLSCISKYSGGCTHYYPGFHVQTNPKVVDKFENDFKRYLTRKIGLEAVMRIRCTKGLYIHTFHGNFFVRSTDLLSLPNINPDAGFAMQMTIEEALTDCDTACFQAALLYTSCKGERRIRVHTLCLPVTASVHEVINSADQQAIVGLLTKMAVDRSLSSSMSDARDALINACVDAIAAFKVVNGGNQPGLLVPPSLKLLPLYILAIMKHVCFRLGTSTKLDERVFAMNQMKTLPLAYLMPYIYPVMYPVHNLDDKNCIVQKDISIPQPPILPLTSEKFERQGAFLLDNGDRMFIYICQGISPRFLQNVFKVSSFDTIPEHLAELPELETPESERLRTFVNYLQSLRPFHATFHILKSDSKSKGEFIQLLVEDRSESTFSYYEFLKHLQELLTK